MAKSESEIRLNYNRAVRQADSLEQLSRNLKSLANNDMSGSISEIAGSWTGENSNSYRGKYEQLKAKVLATAGKLENTATTIRRIAQNTYNAEMRALRIAQERAYRNG